jgi:hypothetical protein
MPDPAKLLKAQSKIIRIGPCEIWSCGEDLVLDSTIPLPDLVVCEFARPRVWFAEVCYYVSARSQSSDKPRLHRYVLTAWPKADESRTRDIALTEEYFEVLLAHRRRTFWENVAFKLLVPFYPVLGFLWSPQKRVLNRIGFEAHSISSLSIYSGFITGFCCAVFLVIFEWGTKSFSLWLLAGAVVFMLDTAMRFHRFLGGADPMPPGFLEWLLRPKYSYE